MKMKKALALTLAALMVFALAACGGSSSSTPAGSTSTPAGSTSAPAPSANDPVRGKTLKVAALNTPTTLAWYDIRGIMAIAQMGYMLEPVMRYDETGAPEPFLVESCVPDSDALTWTLTLKDGIFFSDGSPLDAEALAWNLDYYKENGILAGSFFAKYNHAEAVDDKTVVCHFDAWDALFDYSLCRTMLVASKAAFDENGAEWLAQNPVGTGPFVFSEMNADVNLLMTRNENYWQGEVYLDAVDIVCYAEELVAATALQTGEVHAMITETYSMVEQMTGKGMNEYSVALPSYAYTLCFNSVDPNDPFSNKEVREAVSYAVDTQSILDTLTYGYAVATNQWTVPGSDFYNNDVQAQPHDLDKAKQLMEDAGYADGFSTTLTYPGSSTLSRDACQMIQEQLAAINIEVTLRPIDAAAYVNYIGGWEEGMLLHSMGMEAGAASQYTTTFIHDIAFGLGMNAFDISDDLNELAASIGAAATSDELNRITKEVAKVVFDDDVLCKVVLVTQGVNFVRTEVQNHNFCTVQNLRGDVWEAWIED